MKEFLIFHSSGSSPRVTVERYRRVAKECATAAGVALNVMAVDIDRSHPNNKHRQTNRLIECTTVVDDVVSDHDVNPSDRRVCELIDAVK